MAKAKIPSAFLARFLYGVLNPGDDVLPGPNAIHYYTKTLTMRDCELDMACYEYPDEFLKQLKYLQRLPRILPFMKVTPENHWQGVGVIGHGSYGSVYLCAWHPFGEKNDAFWADYCSEGHLTRRLNAVGCPNVVKVHGWLNLGLRPLLRRPDEDESPPVEKEYFFRILYDYYPGGSLDALFHVYFQNRILLPEAFIWHTFHCMVTAVLYCTNGHANPYVKPGWEEIVHKDIKPSNIFIGSPPSDGAYEEAYPNLYLADFGLAYTLPNEEVRGYKKSFCMEGTGEYIPPEARDLYSDGEISSKVDLYALSHTIQNATKKIYTIYARHEHLLIRSRPDAGSYLPYSVALENLCEECHSSNPDDRPDVYELWQFTGRMAIQWRKRSLENKRKAQQAGSQFYEGMVLFDDQQRGRVFAQGPLRREFLAVASWEHVNQEAINEAKEWVKCHEPRLGDVEEVQN